MVQRYIDLNKGEFPNLCEIMELMLEEIKNIRARIDKLEPGADT